jgi:hypothetical protein
MRVLDMFSWLVVWVVEVARQTDELHRSVQELQARHELSEQRLLRQYEKMSELMDVGCCPYCDSELFDHPQQEPRVIH